MHEETYEQAKKVVKKKKGFYSHFAAYIAVGAFFLIMNILTFDDSGEWWFFFPMLPWGIGLAIHYFSIFGLPGTDILTKEWEQRETEKEMRKIYEERDDFDIDDQLELKERKAIKKKKGWSDGDFV